VIRECVDPAVLGPTSPQGRRFVRAKSSMSSRLGHNGLPIMRCCALFLLSALAVPAAASAQTTGTATRAAAYDLDPAASQLVVRVRPRASALLASFSHEHVVRAGKVSGRIRWDPARPEACGVEVEVAVAGLVVDEPALRQALKVEGTLDEGDRATVTKHMRAEDQLDLAHHPAITFTADRCREEGSGAITVQGRLTVRGHAAAVAVPMKVEFTQEGLRARGELSLRHADLGLTPYSAALGTIGNDELLRFQLSVGATRRPPGG
jgi:polyisoprenoid-binding protein YceI